MPSWNKKTALKELGKLVREIDSLKLEKTRFSANHVRWSAKTLEFMQEVFGGDSRYYLTFTLFDWSYKGTFAASRVDVQEVVENLHMNAYLEQLESAKGLLLAAKDQLERSDIDSVYKGKNTPPESSMIVKVINIIERSLRKTIRNIPTKEKEIQDAFENLLIGAEMPYSREAKNIEYSSKTYIPDFVLDKIDSVVEIKFCGNGTREKELIAEINDDILAYQTSYGNIVFVVYDVGFIRDIDRFVQSFEKNQNVIVKVVKH